MKITLDKITYDAGKLERAIPKIIEKYFQTAYRSSAKGAKERIDKGVLTEDGKVKEIYYCDKEDKGYRWYKAII